MKKRQKRIKELRKIAFAWEEWSVWAWDRAFYVISHVLTVDTIGTIFTGLLLLILAYSLYGSIKLRNRYAEVLSSKEFKRIAKKYKDSEK